MASLILKKNVQDRRRDKLLEEIKLVKSQLNNATIRFELESDSDLVEAAIYEMEALKARYRYLVKSVKAVELN